MLFWIFGMGISFLVVFFLGLKIIYHKRSIALLCVFLLVVLLSTGLFTCLHNYVFNEIVGSAQVVGQCDDLVVDGKIYFDETSNEYFYIDMGLLDARYQRVILDAEQAAQYVWLTEQINNLDIQDMVR